MASQPASRSQRTTVNPSRGSRDTSVQTSVSTARVERVALRLQVDLADQLDVGVGQRGLVDRRSPGDEHLGVTAERERLLQRVRHQHAVGGPLRVAGDHDRGAARAAAGRSTRTSRGP